MIQYLNAEQVAKKLNMTVNYIYQLARHRRKTLSRTFG